LIRLVVFWYFNLVLFFLLRLKGQPTEYPNEEIDKTWIELANVRSGICSASESSVGNIYIDACPAHKVRCWSYLSW
jgi:hypothetical protein